MNLELLTELCETPGPSGREEPIRRLVRRELEPLAGEVSVDPLGNLLAVRPGRGGPRLMLSAHMDEIGFMVTHVDDAGFLRLITLGGFDPKTLTAQRVVVHGRDDLVGVMGSKPVQLSRTPTNAARRSSRTTSTRSSRPATPATSTPASASWRPSARPPRPWRSRPSAARGQPLVR